ncbi:MAG: tetratricopeptide repeat protein [Lachnospiraceae bacterium]|nr:tetratricopeptide repeat protein [Lachnospiraceae bacterium]
MKKRILILLLCSCTAGFLLAGCGSERTEGGQEAAGSEVAQDWQTLYDLGMKYLEEENYEEAVKAFTSALEADPERAEVYTARGNAYILSGEKEEHLTAALADYEEALGLTEISAEAYLGVADVYIRQADYGKALEILNLGLEKTGNDKKIADKIAKIEEGRITDSEGKDRRVSYYKEGILYGYVEYSYEEGRVTCMTTQDPDGNQTGDGECLYDEQGNQIQYWSGSVSDDGMVVLCRHLCEYDENGNCIKNTQYRLDGSVMHTKLYEYDENGKLIKLTYYSESGDVLSNELFEYDGNGNRIKNNCYSGDGTLREFFQYEYDENGTQTKQEHYDADGTMLGYITWELDENGEQISQNVVSLVEE